MALITKVSRKSASKVNGVYRVSMNLVLTDGFEEVLSRDYTQIHNPMNNINIAMDAIIKRMQADINTYKANLTVFESKVFTDSVTYINDKLVV